MKRALKILSVVFVLIIAVVVAGVAILMSQDFNEYKGLIAEQAKEATGRDLTIAGDLNLNISMSPSLSVQGVTFANAGWGSRQEMAKLEKLEAEVALMPLLSGGVEVKRLVLSGLDVILETDKSGKGNWVFGDDAAKVATPDKAGEKGDGEGGGTLPVVHFVRIENVKIAYKDGVTGESHKAEVKSLEVSADSADSPLKLNLAAAYNGIDLTSSGQLGSISALLGGKPLPVELTAKTLGLDIGVDGSIAKPQEAKGLNLGLSIKTANLADTVKAAAVAVPALKDAGPVPAVPFSFSGKAVDGNGGYGVNDMAVNLGGSDITGKLAVMLSGPRPKVTANLASKLLDVDALLPQKDNAAPAKEAAKPAAEPAKKSGKRVFPADPLPLDGLKAADADVSFKGQKIVASGLTVSDVSVKLALANGRLDVKPFGLGIAGGRIGGSVLLNAAKATPALNVAVKGDKVDFGKLLEQFKLTDIAKGTVGMDIALTGNGKSVRQIMAGLTGKTRIVIPEGRIESGALNIVSTDLLNIFDSQDDKAIKCGVVHFNIKGGQANAHAIVFETGGISVVATGGANLANETLKLRVDPRTKKANLASAVMVPVDVHGTFAEPDWTLDMAAMAGNVASSALKTGSAIATMGLSLLVDKALSTAKDAVIPPDNTDYCTPALAGKKVVPGKMAAAKPAPKPSGGSTASPPPAEQPKKEEGVGGAIQGVGEGVGKALKGLFGN